MYVENKQAKRVGEVLEFKVKNNCTTVAIVRNIKTNFIEEWAIYCDGALSLEVRPNFIEV